MKIDRLWLVVLALALAACPPKTPVTTGSATPAATATATVAPAASPTPARIYSKGNVDTTSICQVYVDGWEALTPKERLFAYYLSRASLAGRDLFWDQMHRDALAVRGLMESILVSPGSADPKVVEKIRDWMRKVWVDGSYYDGHTALKIVPGFTRAELTAAAKAAGVANHEATIAKLAPVLFDPSVDPILTAREAKGGKDIIQGSAVNFYQGVSMKEVEAMKAVYGLNSTVVKKAGKPVEVPWRSGSADGKIAPGLYAKELSEAIGWLEKASAVGTPGDQAVIAPLIQFYRTGEYAYFHDYSVAWLKNKPQIEFIHGFIESYDDPRGEKGSFEGYVFIQSKELSTRMEALAKEVLYLESKAPWKDQYKKTKIEPPVATAVQLVAYFGDGGKSTPVGINLPNPQDIRQQYGSKSVYISNIADCSAAVSVASSVKEFALPEDREEIARYALHASEVKVALHEVAGHASGKVSPKLTQDPRAYLREYYSTLEETRADLVALWNAGDERLIAAGVIESSAVRRAMYKMYAMDVLAQLRRAPTGSTLQQDHLRGRQLIVEYARTQGAVETVTRDGKTYYRLISEDLFRSACGELLAELMRAKAEGDYEAAKKLIEAYGVRFDPKRRDEVVARAKAGGVPSAFAFLAPRLSPVKDPSGAIVDARLSYEATFDEQQLRFSGKLPE